MKTFELKGTVRADLGKKATKAVRSNGSIPCELYGVGENIHFSATMADLRKLIYTPEIFVVNLNIDGKEVSICISKSVAWGNTVSKLPIIGDIAKPGNDVIADTDHIAINANMDISLFPVSIFFIITLVFSIKTYIP